jgi:hypothetical protein
MAEDELPKWLPFPRGPDRRPTPPDFRTGASHRVRDIELEASDSLVTNEIDIQSHRSAETNMEATRNLQRLEEQPVQKPLDEIATLVQSLTYGEMMELSEAIWKGQPEGLAVTLENLPALVHRWSKSRSAAAHEASKNAL